KLHTRRPEDDEGGWTLRVESRTESAAGHPYRLSSRGRDQRALHFRLLRWLHRRGRPDDRRSEVLADTNAQRDAAPWSNGLRGSLLVRRVHRRQDRDV